MSGQHGGAYSSLKYQDRNLIELALDMNGGYVLDFSDKTMGEFFWDHFKFDSRDDDWTELGTSKAKRLRCILDKVDARLAPKILRELWSKRRPARARRVPWGPGDEEDRRAQEEEEWLRGRYFEIVSSLEGQDRGPSTEAIEAFESGETLAELIRAINRDIDADKVAPAIDRLHTYCMRRFAGLMQKYGLGALDKSVALPKRVARYREVIKGSRELSGLADGIIRGSIGTLEKLNKARNDHSLAHDNELLDEDEARFVFESVAAVLRFVSALESERES